MDVLELAQDHGRQLAQRTIGLPLAIFFIVIFSIIFCGFLCVYGVFAFFTNDYCNSCREMTGMNGVGDSYVYSETEESYRERSHPPIHSKPRDEEEY